MKKPKRAAAPPPPLTDGQRATQLYERIAPLMTGVPAAIQGNVIAMMMGTFLHGHSVHGKDGKIDIEKTKDLRSRIMIVNTHAAFAYVAASDQSSKEAEDEDGKGRN
jgi:hypothetical protein